MTFWFELVLAVFVGVVLEYTDGSNFDLGKLSTYNRINNACLEKVNHNNYLE